MKTKFSQTISRQFPLLLIFYEVANYLANDAYLPALPHISRALNAGNHLAQLTLTVFFLGNATMQLLLGPIADKYGRCRLLQWSGGIFLASTLYCALSMNIHLFLVARFLQGAAVTGMIISGYGTIHAMYDRNQSIKILAWMASITVLAPALGPLFGAVVLNLAGWRSIFLVLTIWAAVALFFLVRKMPETLGEPIDINIGEMGKRYFSLLKHAPFLRPVLALTMLFSAMIAWIAAGPFLIMQHFGYSAISFGVLQVLVFGSFISGTKTVSKLLESVSITTLMILSLGIALIGGFSCITMGYLAPAYLASIIVSMVIVAFGAGMGFPLFNRLAIEGSNQSMGITMAMFSSFLGIGGLLGSFVVSYIYTGALIQFSLIIFSFTLIGAVLYLKGGEKKTSQQNSTQEI